MSTAEQIQNNLIGVASGEIPLNKEQKKIKELLEMLPLDKKDALLDYKLRSVCFAIDLAYRKWVESGRIPGNATNSTS